MIAYPLIIAIVALVAWAIALPRWPNVATAVWVWYWVGALWFVAGLVQMAWKMPWAQSP